MRNLRRHMCRHEKIGRRRSVSSFYFTRELEANQGAHAVTEESERQIQKRLDRVSKRMDQRLEPGVAALFQTHFTTGKLSATDLDRRGQVPRPVAIHERAAARVRKTEQPQLRVRICPRTREPE